MVNKKVKTSNFLNNFKNLNINNFFTISFFAISFFTINIYLDKNI